jgi:hypothetical protein
VFRKKPKSDPKAELEPAEELARVAEEWKERIDDRVSHLEEDVAFLERILDMYQRKNA